jgi:hypothetical protein
MVAGARVFLTSNPVSATTTDASGGFRLSNVPHGRQTLIVAIDEVGEEYPVRVAPASTRDMGRVVFQVPPRVIRRGPGGGAGWDGEDPEEWLARNPATVSR